MATYVLVHGVIFGGWVWQQVHRQLQAAGHEVFTPTLTGYGERAHLAGPEVDLDIHIQDVVNVLEYEDLRDVVLVGWSYGGMVITAVADRIPERSRSEQPVAASSVTAHDPNCRRVVCRSRR